MLETKEKEKNFAPDEIDLVGVFVRTIRFFITNGRVFLVCTILGLSAALGYYKLKPPVYKSRFTGECMSIPDARAIELINDLDGLRANRDWELLSKKLGMTIDQVRLIKKLEPLSNVAIDKEAKGLDDYLLATTEVAYKFSVIAKVKDNKVLPFLQKGIIKYLSDNEYSTIRVNRFIENRKSLLNFVEYELKKLDSLNLLFANKIVNSSSSTSLSSPGDFKAMVIALQEKKLMIQDELRFASAVRVIQGFTPFKEPVEPVLPIVLAQFISLFNGLGLLFIFIRQLKGVYERNKLKYS